jgi:hypothetical protein
MRRILEVDKYNPAMPDSSPNRCGLPRNGLETVDHLPEARRIADRRNDRLKRIHGIAGETHRVGKDLLHCRQHAAGKVKQGLKPNEKIRQMHTHRQRNSDHCGGDDQQQRHQTCTFASEMGKRQVALRSVIRTFVGGLGVPIKDSRILEDDLAFFHPVIVHYCPQIQNP